MKYKHEAIFCIVNSGYSEMVMDAAKKLGARGGTVINARGTAPKDAGLNTAGQGIAFALPVDSVVGLSEQSDKKE